MKKIILIGAGAAVLLAGGIGGTIAFLDMGHHAKSAAAAKPAPPKPKPIYFSQLSDVVVTVPADQNNDGNAYIQFSVQFSTFNQTALTSFTSLEPIIKSQIINLLMTQTAKELVNPATHEALAKNCLAIANKVLNTSGQFTPPNPFTAAYITNIVEQD